MELKDLIAPKDVIELRQKLCDACEHSKFGMCTKCGCIIAAKTRTALAECPIKKWERVEPENV